MTWYFSLLGSYLIGSIPFAVLWTWGVVDIKSVGSGNAGATNVLRTTTKLRALGTLICDIAKGWVPVWLALHMGWTLQEAALLGSASILGHIFPVWLKGKGGKGVATALGVYSGVHLYLGLLTVAVWLVAAKVFRISSLSALIAFCVAPFIGYWLAIPDSLIIWMMCLSTLILWTHRSNITRLLKGTEA